MGYRGDVPDIAITVDGHAALTVEQAATIGDRPLWTV